MNWRLPLMAPTFFTRKNLVIDEMMIVSPGATRKVQVVPEPPRKMNILVATPTFTLTIRDVSTTKELYDVVDSRLQKLSKPRALWHVAPQKTHSVTLYQGLKPLSRNPILLQDYGLHNNDTIRFVFHPMKGGSKSTIQLPTYTIVSECEKQLLDEWHVQTIDEYIPKQVYDVVLDQFFRFKGGDFCVKLLEDVCLLVAQIVNARSKVDYTIALITFVKLRNQGSLFSGSHLSKLSDYFHKVFDSFEVQSVDSTFKSLRGYLERYEEIRNAPVFKKLYKFAMYALSLSLFEKVGITFDNLRYTKLEAESVKKKFTMGVDFVHTMVDTLLFLCERGYQCMKTGSMDPIYHSGSSYEKWFNVATDLKHKSTLLAFPEAHGIDRFSFLADLREAVEQGEAIYKHAARMGEYERKTVRALVSELAMILANETTKREAQKERKAPFSVLLYGGSSIGKSTLTKMLFYQYGKVHNLPIGSEFKYTRNACDDFWSGFNSSQWCVQLDDIAFMHPNKAQAGDPSIMEMLQVVNNVPFVPNQAELSDKGRTPVRCEMVIATSNCNDLNAYHYFQTPLAVQRRLPFVIDVKPKKEFAKYECMLDSSKIEQVDGEWPNYWLYTVYGVEPVGTERLRQQGKLVELQVFSETNAFLAWFSKESLRHAEVQKMVSDCDMNMAGIELCRECWYPAAQCDCEVIQTIDTTAPVAVVEDVTPEPLTWTELFKYIILHIVLYAVSSRWTFEFVRWCLDRLVVRSMLEARFVAPKEKIDHMKRTFRTMGNTVEARIGYSPLLARIVVGVTSAYATYKVTSSIYDFCTKPTLSVQGNQPSTESVNQDASVVTQPRASVRSGRAPRASNDEKPNVWHKSNFALTTFDVSPVTRSWKRFDDEEMKARIAKSCYHFRSFRLEGGREVQRVIRATAVTGHLYMCNNHGLPETATFELAIVHGSCDTGVNSNIRILVTQEDIFRLPKQDVAFIRIRNLPPSKDITQLFMEDSLRGTLQGTYVGRNEDGTIFTRQVEALRRQDEYKCAALATCASAFFGKVKVPTQIGDCGSVLLASTGYGPVLLGVHFLGKHNEVGVTVVNQSTIKMGLAHFAEPQVQSCEPRISAPSAPREVKDLSERATVRWLEEGTANVYGSFSGFRASPSSSVERTIMCESMLKRGYTVKHSAPVMKGWQPWNIALQDMVKPVTMINTAILASCVDSFTKSILQALPPGELEDVMVYDDITALNGAPGVAYVDSINRNTSAGAPWKKSKKHFLNPTPPMHGLQDPVEAVPEIMTRVDEIIEGYEDGRRYSPVFCAHLKDEATKFAKVQAGKTRVFTGAPFDWSFVVRKYLLSIIRIVQKNRFVFESGPGTNCHSNQWGEIRDYLTQHGEDRMVAGDYASFDKSMPPTIILAAFDVIRNLCEEAGYSPAELRVVQGIAEDTAFPVVDFNGDLMEFYGSNPSGHPLTVIINGLANALYMRYCYAVLSPLGTCENFKEHVALMTYGDDNIMGVSKDAPFFTHTTIQGVLKDVGIKYTMADKEAVSKPYIHISECSFLKRTWRWDEDVGAHLCPLEEDSINKSLTVWCASKTITAKEQAVAAMSSASAEYFFYGRDIFEQKRTMFLEVVDEIDAGAYLEPNSFPTYSELFTRFWSAN